MSAQVIALWQPLACQEVASRVASRDHEATADLVLDVALKEATALLTRPDFTPEYNLARAELVIQRAGESAGRLLGDRRAE